MPGRDGHGPRGEGARTGRGQGSCGPNQENDKTTKENQKPTLVQDEEEKVQPYHKGDKWPESEAK